MGRVRSFEGYDNNRPEIQWEGEEKVIRGKVSKV
jgi:hypothetical protein